jgi:hypothetical protein
MISDISPVIAGRGNLVADTVLITHTAFNSTQSELRKELRANGVDPSLLWITSFIKSESIPEDVLYKYLIVEMKQIKPKNIILINNNDMNMTCDLLVSDLKSVSCVSMAQDATLSESIKLALPYCKQA